MKLEVCCISGMLCAGCLWQNEPKWTQNESLEYVEMIKCLYPERTKKQNHKCFLYYTNAFFNKNTTYTRRHTGVLSPVMCKQRHWLPQCLLGENVKTWLTQAASTSQLWSMNWKSLIFPGNREDLFVQMLLLAHTTAVCLATDGTHGTGVQ